METSDFQNSVFEALKGSAKSCQDLTQYVLKAGNHLRVGEIQEGNDLLLGILDDFGQLIAFLEDVTQCQDLSDILIEQATEAISTESNATVGILQMAYEAQENQDGPISLHSLPSHLPGTALLSSPPRKRPCR